MLPADLQDADFSKCRVLLTRGTGVVSGLIRWQTRGRYAHAALLLPDGRVLESMQGAGVRVIRPASLTPYDQFDVVGFPPDGWRKAISFAFSKLGAGYDYWAVVRFVSRRNMPENEKWFCSELVFRSVLAGGVRLLERIQAEEVGPSCLAYSPFLVESAVA